MCEHTCSKRFTDEDRASSEPTPECSIGSCCRRARGASTTLGGLADRWPLVPFGQQVVLARPFDLLLAVRHHLLLRAVDEVGADEVAGAFG
ncbi:MAG: hypothetical protein LC777_00900 [Actinobacteria bacterium]|nr:hypothetical protein [Actinomycetota bacterium]